MVTTATERIPVVLTGQALRSLRDSGYSLPAALGEVVDNSLEANANHIGVRLDEAQEKGKRHIHRIAVSDDGNGMDDYTLQHYLQIGFSTRYMSTSTIGKYGVGAKLAALNFGRRIDVWSRDDAAKPWRHTFFDLDALSDAEKRGEPVGIEPPDEEPVPNDLIEMLPPGTGTLVVWSRVDRLEEGRRAPDATALRVDVEKEFSRMFRYFLDGGININVNGTDLLPHDPLFLMKDTWADKVLNEHVARLAKAARADGEEREPEPRHFGAQTIATEAIKVGGSEAKATLTLYPSEVTRQRGRGNDDLAKRLRVPENEGAISFIRLDREINYTNVPRIFPRGVEDADRFFGIEIAFTPELDDYFGVRNVKRGVEPHDELRNKLRAFLQKYLPEARVKLDESWGQAAQEAKEHRGEHTEILEAVKDVDRVLPKSRVKESADEKERDRAWDDLARDVVGNDEETKASYLERVKELPFVIESVDFPGSVFMDIQHVDRKVLIRLNTRHRFYREMWEPIKSIAERDAGSVSPEEAVRTARRTLEALTLMVVAYGKAESMDEAPREHFGELRIHWGGFLDTLMGKIKGVL